MDRTFAWIATPQYDHDAVRPGHSVLGSVPYQLRAKLLQQGGIEGPPSLLRAATHSPDPLPNAHPRPLVERWYIDVRLASGLCRVLYLLLMLDELFHLTLHQGSVGGGRGRGRERH